VKVVFKNKDMPPGASGAKHWLAARQRASQAIAV